MGLFRPTILDDRGRRVPMAAIGTFFKLEYVLWPCALPITRTENQRIADRAERDADWSYRLPRGREWLVALVPMLTAQLPMWLIRTWYTRLGWWSLAFLGVWWLMCLVMMGRVMWMLAADVMISANRNAAIAERICPSCAYSLASISPDPDGLTVCPECGSAWRHAATPIA